jgi:hypothetical protein
MNTAPGDDAMTVRYHTQVPKLEDVRRPLAWLIHPDDVVRFAAEGKHCETRRCRNAVSTVTWRFWRSAEAGRVLLHIVCEQHGQEFAARHHIHIEPPAAAPRRGRNRPGGTS